MRTLGIIFIILSISFATTALAVDFDGSSPLTCKVKLSHDCLRTEKACATTTHEDTSTSIIGIDFAKKQIRSPLRKALLSVQSAVANPDSLVLQGSDLFIAWSGLVDRKTGALTVALADKDGTYVYFGMCTVAEKK